MIVRPDAGGAVRHVARVRLGIGGQVGKALDLAVGKDREIARIINHIAQQIVGVPVEAGLALNRDRQRRSAC